MRNIGEKNIIKIKNLLRLIVFNIYSLRFNLEEEKIKKILKELKKII